MGWDWAISLMPYGLAWRQRRREFHQFFNSNAIKNYAAIAEERIVLFLRSLAREPENFLSLTHL